MIPQVKRVHGSRKPDEFDDNIIQYEVINTGYVKDLSSFTMQEEYCLQAKASVNFWANKAQYQTALKIAERTLNAHLYGDMYAEIHKTRLAVSNGDRKAAFAAIDAMERILESKR